METITITRRDHGDHGEYRAKLEGNPYIGRLTWVLRDGARVADHTIVPPEIGGRGIAGKLVDDMIADARENHFKILPACSYVVAAFDKHPEWADLKAG